MTATSQPTKTPAEAYKEYYEPAIFEPLTAHVLECASPKAGDRILDIACGPGIIARRAAELAGPTGHVVGVDINPGMLDVARSRPAPQGAEIEWRQGDGTDLDLPDSSFDVVYCQQGLQFFPDRSAGTREMRRVLEDGGRAVVATWQGVDRLPLFEAIFAVEEPHLKSFGIDISGEQLAAPFSLGSADELRSLLEGAGFTDVEIVERAIDARFADADHFIERMEFAYAAVIPQFASDPSKFEAYVEAVSRDTKQIVEQHRDGDFILMPMHTNIAVAS